MTFQQQTQKQQNHLIPIIMMIALFAMISFVTGLSSPLGAVLKNQFNVSDASATLGIMMNFIAYAVMGIPSGLLLKKIGYKSTALTAVAVGFVGIGIQILSGYFGSFGIYLLGAFIAGMSMCMLNTVVNPMLNTLGGGGKKGNQLIQIGGTFNSLAATIVPVLVGLLAGVIAEAKISDIFPLLYIALGVFGVVFIVLFITNIPDPETKEEGNSSVIRSPFSFPHFNFGLIAIFVYVGVEVAVPATLFYFLTYPADNGGQGMDATAAGSVVGTYWFLMMIGRFAGAAIAGSVTSRSMLTVASGIGTLLVISGMYFSVATVINMPVFLTDATGRLSFGTTQVPINAVCFALIGLCTSVMWGGIFNLAVEGLGNATAKASGFFMVMVCGGGIIPFLQNLVVPSTGFLNSYWVILVCMLYLLFYAIAGSKPKKIMLSDPF